MGDGIVGGAETAPPCPLCNDTGQRHVRRPGDPRKQLRLIPCHCTFAKGTK